MGFLGVNPKRNRRLDTLRKTCVPLFGIPSPIPTYPGLELEQNIVKEFGRRLQNLDARENRAAVLKEQAVRFRAITRDGLGTNQQPFMLLFGESLYSAVIPDLMCADDLQAFMKVWMIRGYVPATITALKPGKYWTYSLEQDFKSI